MPKALTRLAPLQDCWEGLEQAVRLAWAAHCEAQLQAAVDQLRVADSRADDSASEVRDLGLFLHQSWWLCLLLGWLRAV